MITEDAVLPLDGGALQIGYLSTAHSDGDPPAFVEPDLVPISRDIIFEGRVLFTESADTPIG